MAELLLEKPEPGLTATVENLGEEGDVLVLDFDTGDALLEREGDNLVFRFDDGGSVVLADFYAAYNSELMPEFEIGGERIAGADFFAALDSSLMPAAGPAAGDAVRNNRYSESAGLDLMGGVDRLDGLDIGFDDGAEPDDDITAYGGEAGGGGRPIWAPFPSAWIPPALPRAVRSPEPSR
jgi:hypothetical protein